MPYCKQQKQNGNKYLIPRSIRTAFRLFLMLHPWKWKIIIYARLLHMFTIVYIPYKVLYSTTHSTRIKLIALLFFDMKYTCYLYTGKVWLHTYVVFETFPITFSLLIRNTIKKTGKRIVTVTMYHVIHVMLALYRLACTVCTVNTHS